MAEVGRIGHDARRVKIQIGVRGLQATMLRVRQAKTHHRAPSLTYLHVKSYPQSSSRQKLVNAAIGHAVEIPAQDDGQVPRHHELLQLFSSGQHACDVQNQHKKWTSA